MQSKNGGFASFDADNDHTYLNEIPFADHGALLDPPTEDVSARCAMLLARLADSGRKLDRLKENVSNTFSVLSSRMVHGTDDGEPIIFTALGRCLSLWRRKA